MKLQIEALERTRHDDKINWVTAGFMFAFHVGALAAVFFFTWKALLVSMIYLGLMWIIRQMVIEEPAAAPAVRRAAVSPQRSA